VAQCVLTAGADINAAAGRCVVHTHRLHLYRVANSAHRDKFTPLHFAVVNGHIDMLLCLLDAGADCSARDGYAMTCSSCVIVAA
jgi:ankyrin repeat protein